VTGVTGAAGVTGVAVTAAVGAEVVVAVVAEVSVRFWACSELVVVTAVGAEAGVTAVGAEAGVILCLAALLWCVTESEVLPALLTIWAATRWVVPAP
jgi:hypothetical protein